MKKWATLLAGSACALSLFSGSVAADENKELVATLMEKGIDHEWLLTEGDHSWPVWRGYLADFAPLLFRAEN